MIPSSPSSTSGAGTSKYRGVTEQSPGLWVARLYVRKKSAETRVKDFHNPIYIGVYDSPEKAARAYDAASLCVFGSKPDVHLRLNFPDALPQISYPEGQVLTVPEVKKVANRHANNGSIQAAQDMQEPTNAREVQYEEANNGIAKDKLPSPVTARPAEVLYYDFMSRSESAPVPKVINLALPVSPCPAEKPFYDFLGVEKTGLYYDFMRLSESAPVPKVINLASPVSPCPAEKPFYDFLGVEKTPPEPEVLNNAEHENGDSSS